jgi:PGM1 C-terminal domain
VQSPPAIPWDLSPEGEAEAFARLKPRLATLWRDVFAREDEAYTSVVVPSVTVEPGELLRDPGSLYLEETLLFLLIRLRNPRARVVYVTSQPIPEVVLEYYLQFLAGIPASHARWRVTLLTAYDGSPRPLTSKILERPRLLARIRAAIPDPSRAYLTVFRSTCLERRLAVLLGIPLNAADPEMETLSTKSGARRVFREAGVEVPLGREDVRSEAEIVEALRDLRRQRPGLVRAVLKLDASLWDEGHAVLRYPDSDSEDALRRALRRVLLAATTETPETYLERFERTGGVVEELVPDVRATASAQMRLNPLGDVIPTSTHDELRGGATGLGNEGCRFPADDRYRSLVQETGLRVARVLAAKRLVSRVSIELLVCGEGGVGDVRLLGNEINFGVGGSTHPLLAVRFLCGGHVDAETGLLRCPSGRPKYYRATDHLQADAYRSFLPEDLIEILTLNGFNFSPHTECGALVYMLGALSQFGRVGLLAVGGSRDEADEVFGRTVQTLDEESRPQLGRPFGRAH